MIDEYVHCMMMNHRASIDDAGRHTVYETTTRAIHTNNTHTPTHAHRTTHPPLALTLQTDRRLQQQTKVIT